MQDNLQEKNDVTDPNFYQYLIEQRLIESKSIQKILKKFDSSRSLVDNLLEHALIPPRLLATALADYHSLPFFDLSNMNQRLIPQQLLTIPLVKKGLALPIEMTTDHLLLAVADPNIPELNEISFYCELPVKLVIVETDKLNSLIQEVMKKVLQISLSTDNSFIINYVHQLLLDAIEQHASDIHFEPYEKYYRVRYRQDGLLREIARPPLNIIPQIVTRLKILANLDIAEHRLPQDGRFRITFSPTKNIDFRISTCPTAHGEKVAVRVLNNIHHLGELCNLGMSSRQLTIFQTSIHKPQGIIVVTGPTGSGKTTTLYTALKTINTPDKNICTVEDPIEMTLPGVNQIAANLKTGLTFSKALRAFLRQDPDVIMVGEIRDKETAQIAIRAAQTGHLVLTTLHTNSAAETIERLANMGLPTYNLATTLTLLIAQRLARKLCEQCKQPQHLPLSTLIKAGYDEETANHLIPYEAKGCSACYKGYAGRVALFEVMEVDKELAQTMMAGATSSDIQQYAQQKGMKSLYQDGLQKVKQGITSLTELHRII